MLNFKNHHYLNTKGNFSSVKCLFKWFCITCHSTKKSLRKNQKAMATHYHKACIGSETPIQQNVERIQWVSRHGTDVVLRCSFLQGN